MRKQITVGDLIAVLQKFDPDLPVYDCYDDENEGACWFNLDKPKPRRKKLYVLQRQNADGDKIMRLTEKKMQGWKVMASMDVLVLYPQAKGVIEVG